jgi:two-component system, response regulator
LENKRILLVEDNPDDIDLMLHAFRKGSLKNEVTVVRDGAEALDYLFGTGQYYGRDINVTPDVVLLDLRLPKLNGLQVLQRIRDHEHTRLIPVVILSASDKAEDILQGYNTGANSYVLKPTSFSQFSDTVQSLGLYWLVLNETPPQHG